MKAPERIALDVERASPSTAAYLLRFADGGETSFVLGHMDAVEGHGFLALGGAVAEAAAASADRAGPAEATDPAHPPDALDWTLVMAMREAFDGRGLQKLSLELPATEEALVLRCRAVGFQLEGRFRQHLPGARRGDLLRLALSARDWRSLAQPLQQRLEAGAKAQQDDDPFAPGRRHLERYRISAEDIDRFAEASGDRNPIHMSDEAGRAAGFQGRIAHGILAAATISRLLGTVFPGHGTVYLSQELRFMRPVYPGQELSAELTVLRRAGQRATLRTLVLDAEGQTLVDGEAEVMLPKGPAAQG